MSAESVTSFKPRHIDESSVTAAANARDHRIQPELIDMSEQVSFLRLFSEYKLRSTPEDIVSVGRSNTGKGVQPIDGFYASLDVASFLRRFCSDEIKAQHRSAAEAINAAEKDKKKHVDLNHIPIMDGVKIESATSDQVTEAVKQLGRNVYKTLHSYPEIWAAVAGKIEQTLATTPAPAPKQPERTEEPEFRASEFQMA